MNIQAYKHTTQLSVFLCLLFLSFSSNAQRMTISDGQIPYFAMLKGTKSHYLLVSNPKFCDQAPGPCNFFIESEYGHLHRNHLILRPNRYTLFDLKEADCFAAGISSTQDVQETYKLMLAPEEAAKYAIPGDLKARAENVKACAIKANNWAE